MNDDHWQMLEANRKRADEVRADLAERQARRSHRDDGFSSDWAAGMPTPAPTPTPRSLTDAEIEQKIATALAAQARDFESLIDDRIALAIAASDEHWRNLTGLMISNLRKSWRSEFAAEIEKVDLAVRGLMHELTMNMRQAAAVETGQRDVIDLSKRRA